MSCFHGEVYGYILYCAGAIFSLPVFFFFLHCFRHEVNFKEQLTLNGVSQFYICVEEWPGLAEWMMQPKHSAVTTWKWCFAGEISNLSNAQQIWSMVVRYISVWGSSFLLLTRRCSSASSFAASSSRLVDNINVSSPPTTHLATHASSPS